MRPIYKVSESFVGRRLVLCICTALLLPTILGIPASATASFDEENEEQLPQRQPISEPTDARSPDTIPPVSTYSRAAPSASVPSDSSPTYSIRLPQAVTGSVVPTIPTGKPLTPPGNSFMPRVASQDPDHPLAWRATAEAIRQQQPSSSLVVFNLRSDFKNTYNNLLSEFESCGWSLSSLSLPAGHFLFRVPKSPSTTGSVRSSDDAAAWLIVAISPADAENTEVRVKIQSRHSSQFLTPLNAAVQRCQLKSNGNQLL